MYFIPGSKNSVADSSLLRISEGVAPISFQNKLVHGCNRKKRTKNSGPMAVDVHTHSPLPTIVTWGEERGQISQSPSPIDHHAHPLTHSYLVFMASLKFQLKLRKARGKKCINKRINCFHTLVFNIVIVISIARRAHEYTHIYIILLSLSIFFLFFT